MNKDRFSDRRLSQISSLKELQSTRRKISNRLDILEDKFEHTSVWSLLNFEGAMQNFVRKAASIREAWDSILEIVRSLRDRGEKCIETPVYRVFEMFRAHQGAQAVSVDVNDEKISASASRKEDKLFLTLANLSFSEDKEISLDGCPATKAAMLLLAPPSPIDYNDFDMPYRVQPIRITHATDKPIVLPKGAVMAISIPLEEEELQ